MHLQITSVPVVTPLGRKTALAIETSSAMALGSAASAAQEKVDADMKDANANKRARDETVQQARDQAHAELTGASFGQPSLKAGACAFRPHLGQPAMAADDHHAVEPKCVQSPRARIRAQQQARPWILPSCPTTAASGSTTGAHHAASESRKQCHRGGPALAPAGRGTCSSRLAFQQQGGAQFIPEGDEGRGGT